MQEPATLRYWCELIDDIVLRCEEAVDPQPDEEGAIIRGLCDSLRRAPLCVAHFLPVLDDGELEPYLALGAGEKVLLKICARVGVLVSRSSTGRAFATVGIPEAGIERSFARDTSLPLAMVGAIGLAAIDIVEKSEESA